MCGIAAIFNYRTGEPIDRDELTRIREAMSLRGPDGCGDWTSSDGRIGLGHRRLSIIDLSPAGAQPMKNRDGSLVVTFNGEIYNYRQLRSGLEQKGYRFQSTSDTEVLLHLYEAEGEAMVGKLRGMYAFAIWDDRNQGLFIARDPFGIKPLYLADDGTTLRVASQVKALLAGGGVDTAPEPAGHVGFFLWGHVPSPYTFYRGIRGLTAGTTLWVDRLGNHRLHTFCSIPGILADAEERRGQMGDGVAPHPGPLPGGERQSLLRSALADSVRHHLIADVPVGVFLSSGLDSSTITALAAESGSNLRTVTLAFEEFRGKPEDESPLAAQVAARYGTRHQTVWVGKHDFQESFTRVMQAMDQPSCDGINSFFVSFAAARAGLKVALSGLGGDELFGGYPSFSEIPRVVRFLKPFSASALQPLNLRFRLISAPVLRRFTSPKYASLLEYGGTYGGAYLLRRGMFMPWELPEVLDPELVREGWRELQSQARLDQTAKGLKSPFLKVSALEMCWYMRNQLLRDTDWAGMNHSVEVRTPLVDVELLRNLAPLLASDTPPTKRDMAISPLSPLPSSILDRRKTGFSIPVRQWLLDDDDGFGRDRGLRGWSRLVYRHCTGAGPVRDKRSRPLPGAAEPKLPSDTAPQPARAGGKRFLVLVSDAFGGHGGIAKFDRDLLKALCSFPACGQAVAIPRLMQEPPGSLPAKLIWNTDGLGGKLRYLWAVLKITSRNHATLNPQPPEELSSGFDLLICGHINLLPFAFLHRLWFKTPIALIIYGIEAWTPPRRLFAKFLARRVDRFWAVSEITKARFLAWTGLPPERGLVLPNCVDASLFGAGPKSPALLQRYGLRDKTVIMTLGRLASEERYKGFDEVLEVLPDLARQIPNLAYLIAGDGSDRPRLAQKARSLGLSVADWATAPVSSGPLSADAPSPHSDLPSPMVVFVGRISDAEKADHYRLADAYVMPSQGEGFGFVYLEALACGVPVVASKVDGSREAVRNGELGELVDPKNPEEIKAATLRALSNHHGSQLRTPPLGLDYFSYANFEQRVHQILRSFEETNDREKLIR